MNEKVLSWRCDVCGKTINSFYEQQFNINKQQHIEKHKRKKEVE